MKILVALTYYRPHVSGLTIYVERLSRSLAKLGHEVTILTSQFDRHLPRKETISGVNILRVPVAFRVSKGVVMPTIGIEATRQVLAHDVVSVHLPQFDAWGIALRGRLFNRPTVLTYHCDLRLPRGVINRLANTVVNLANRLAGTLSHRVVAYTEDFAVNSPFLSRYLNKLDVISPPVEIAELGPEDELAFSSEYTKGKSPIIGIAARLATEKGVEYLAQAMPKILSIHPNAHVLFAGQHENVLGESEYRKRLQPQLDVLKDHWSFLGVLDPERMASFYRACSVTVLPSVNSTESFGLVQIESMMCGTPVVASNLPGVRQPVQITNMGRIVPIRDADALADAILEILANPQSYQGNPQKITADFSPVATAQKYEALFEQLLTKKDNAKFQ
jgi:glycosyltransferase involved in cell wall biosynthesis